MNGAFILAKKIIIIRALSSVLTLEIETAKDGREALDKLKAMAESHDDLSQEISLIISDIEMPELDGYTLTSEIREDPRLKNIKAS